MDNPYLNHNAVSFKEQQKNHSLSKYKTENEKMKEENVKNETNEDKLKKGIGTKESEKIEAKPVKVQTVEIEKVKNKEGKEIGDKVVLVSKHPDKDEAIAISKVKYLKGDKVTISGLWYNEDSDGLIPKNSALANLMRKYKAEKVEDLKEKEIQTEKDEGGYLIAKAY